jgi:hypothetical protein
MMTWRWWWWWWPSQSSADKNGRVNTINTDKYEEKEI